VHAGGEFGGADNRGEKRNVLIVSVLLPIIIDLALRNKTQRRIEVLQMREQPVLLQVATAPEAVMLDTEVEDHAPAAILVSQVFSDCHVAAPLAVRGSMLGADRVSSSAEERAEHRDHPIVRLGCTDVRACVVAVKLDTELLFSMIASGLFLWRGRETSTGTSKPIVVETN